MQTIHTNIPESAAGDTKACRRRIDLLRRRLSLLRGKDRLLMTMYLENGNSARQLAHLAGVSESTIARRIQKVTRRLLNGEYIRCLRNRSELTKAELAVAKDYFIHGLSQKKIALKRGYNRYQLGRIFERIDQVIRASEKA